MRGHGENHEGLRWDPRRGSRGFRSVLAEAVRCPADSNFGHDGHEALGLDGDGAQVDQDIFDMIFDPLHDGYLLFE